MVAEVALTEVAGVVTNMEGVEVTVGEMSVETGRKGMGRMGKGG